MHNIILLLVSLAWMVLPAISLPHRRTLQFDTRPVKVQVVAIRTERLVNQESNAEDLLNLIWRYESYFRAFEPQIPSNFENNPFRNNLMDHHFADYKAFTEDYNRILGWWRIKTNAPPQDNYKYEMFNVVRTEINQRWRIVRAAGWLGKGPLELPDAPWREKAEILERLAFCDLYELSRDDEILSVLPNSKTERGESVRKQVQEEYGSFTRAMEDSMPFLFAGEDHCADAIIRQWRQHLPEDLLHPEHPMDSMKSAENSPPRRSSVESLWEYLKTTKAGVWLRKILEFFVKGQNSYGTV